MLAMRPEASIAPLAFLPTTVLPFQNHSAQCALKPAMPHTIFPSCTKVGIPHLMVSSTLELPAWITLRRCLRIGRANGAQPSMYLPTLGSRLGIACLFERCQRS